MSRCRQSTWISRGFQASNMRYDYICDDCKTLFEVERKLNDASPIHCPECDSGNVRKVFLQVPGIALHFTRGTGGPKGDWVYLPAVERTRTVDRRKRRVSKKKLVQVEVV